MRVCVCVREHVQIVLFAGSNRTSSVVEEEKTTSQICGDFSTSFFTMFQVATPPYP
ncbi:MAG: hypothetical protein ACPIOQ_03055 [Promethearchaeia archaeon]